MSQVTRVLEMLRRAGPAGVCSLTFYQSDLPHARNRISVELKARGYVVTAAVCEEGDHGATAYFRYVLVSEPTPAEEPSVRAGGGAGGSSIRMEQLALIGIE